MRQVERHLPEYRRLAAGHSFWERCQDPDLCTTITMRSIERYGALAAAIVFSDILTPLPALGYEVEYDGGIRFDATLRDNDFSRRIEPLPPGLLLSTSIFRQCRWAWGVLRLRG